jgi:hypothetical protein
MKKLLLATAIITMMVIGCTKEQNPPAPIITTTPNSQPTDTVITPVDTIPSDTVITPVDTIPTDTIPVDTITTKIVMITVYGSGIEFFCNHTTDGQYISTNYNPGMKLYTFEYELSAGEYITVYGSTLHTLGGNDYFKINSWINGNYYDFNNYIYSTTLNYTITNNFN